jgi:putative transposase
MPTTDRGVRMWGQKNLHAARTKVRGKGLEYSRESLPQETKDYLKAQDLAAILQNLPAAPQAVSAPVLSDQALVVAGTRQVQLMDGAPTEPETDAHQRERELARLVVIRTLHEIRHTQGTTTQGAARILLENARAGRLAPVVMTKLRRACDERGCRAAAAEDDLPSVMTLRRWAARHKAGKSLVPLRSTVPDLTVRPWYRPFFALTDRPQKPTLKWALEQLVANWRPEWADVPGGGPPTYDAARRAYEKRSRLDILKGRHTGSALRAKTFYHKRTYAGLPPFTEVHSDGWTTHFTAPHPVTGQFVTYEVWHFHDVATRYVTPMAVGTTENTDVILRGLESCIRVGGMIAIWQTDHTSSVKNARVMEEHSGLADRLGITVVHPQEVGNSQANGIAENFNTWLDREARELATYQHPQRMDSGTFVRVRRITNAMVKASDKPEERARLRAQAMRTGKGLVFDTHAEALAWLAEREKRWNNHPHRELPRVRNAAGKLVHMTPQQSLDAARAAGWEPVEITEAQIVEQFRPHVRKKVTRGTVTPFGGMRYHHEELAHHEGEEVLVAMDKDKPEHVWVKTLAGDLIAYCRFVAAVRSRTESMQEHTDRKRAEAQKKLREQQIADIDARMAGPVLDLPAPPVFELQTMPAWRQVEEVQGEVRQMSFIETMQHLQELEDRKKARDAEEAAAEAALAAELAEKEATG